MTRRAFIISAATAAFAFSLAASGCGAGSSIANSLIGGIGNQVAGGDSARVTGVSRSVLTIPSGTAPQEYTYLSGKKLSYRVRLDMTGTGFRNANVPTPAGTLNRYAVYLEDSFFTQVDLAVSGDNLSADIAIPAEYTQGEELNKNRRVIVYDRLDQREIPFSSESAAVVRVEFGQ